MASPAWMRPASALLGLTLALAACGSGGVRPADTLIPTGIGTVRTGTIEIPARGPLWPGLGGGARHTGEASAPGPVAARVQAAVAGVPVPGAAQVAVGADGTAYVAGISPRAVAAVSPAGQVLWQKTLAGTGGQTPAIGPDGTVYVFSGARLLALHPADGSEKWAVPLPAGAPLPENGPAPAPVAAGDDRIYAAAGGVLAAISAGGEVVWRWPREGAAQWLGTPGVGPDGTVYLPAVLAGGQAALVGLDAGGEELWRHPLPGRPGTPAVAADGLAHVAVPENGGTATVYAVRLNGKLRWQRRVAGVVWPVASLSLGEVYLGAYPLPAQEGAPLAGNGVTAVGPGVVDTAGNRYGLQRRENRWELSCLDKQGRTLWEHALQEPGSLPVVAGGRVYVVDAGRLMLIGAEP